MKKDCMIAVLFHLKHPFVFINFIFRGFGNVKTSFKFVYVLECL